MKHELRPIVSAALADLRRRFDVVVCEGAGSPAEINLRANDLTNMWLAREAELPTLIVADIDRGGVFASLFGTLALLDAGDQARVAGFVINKFRGDLGVLEPGLERLRELTGRPTLGVLPFVEDLWMDAEDSLALEHAGGRAEAPAAGGDTLDIAVVRLRWISNFTDADALSAEPGVRVRFTKSAADIERADLVVIPGTKATVEDLERLRASGLADALIARARAGAPILGICGGYQLLGRRVVDDVESGRGEIEGLGILPIQTRFERDKILRHVTGVSPALDGVPAGGYEIRHGRVELDPGADARPLLIDAGGNPEGIVHRSVLGTSWHGLLEHDEFRRTLLKRVARARGRRFVPGSTPFATARAKRLDALGDLVAQHLDTDRLTALIERGTPDDLPTIQTEVRPCSAL
jgi:adenosylcobyric acid synthase